MPRLPRALLAAALTLSVAGVAALTRADVPTVVAAAMPATTTSAAPPPSTTTTTTASATTTMPPAPRVAAPTQPPATAPRPTATTAAPAARVASGAKESCGWSWDAIRVDDGSSNEVTMMLDVARRPNATVTIFADFAGPDSPTAARTVTTDGDGQASARFPVSEDKRDWTITVSASFAAGGACPPETFTLDY